MGGPEMAPDSDSLTETQRTILRLAANNPEISNAEIAEETETHVALVRDLRSEHDGLPADDAESASAGDSDGESHDEPTAVQSEILALALDDPDLTNRAIADQLDARIALVRDTRRSYEDEVSLADLDAEPPSSGDTEPPATADADDGGNGKLVALLLVVVLLLGLALLLM